MMTKVWSKRRITYLALLAILLIFCYIFSFNKIYFYVFLMPYLFLVLIKYIFKYF